jgi:hypothetical protein
MTTLDLNKQIDEARLAVAQAQGSLQVWLALREAGAVVSMPDKTYHTEMPNIEPVQSQSA